MWHFGKNDEMWVCSAKQDAFMSFRSNKCFFDIMMGNHFLVSKLSMQSASILIFLTIPKKTFLSLVEIPLISMHLSRKSSSS